MVSRPFPTPPTSPAPLAPPHRPGPSWRSHRLDPLLARLADAASPATSLSRRDALDEFWRACAERGTPLVHPVDERDLVEHVEQSQPVEQTPDLVDGATSLLTFVWRAPADAGPVIVQANRLFDPTQIENSLLENLTGTDVWWAAFEVPSQWRGSYHFVQLRDVPNPTSTGLTEVERRVALREHATTSAMADPLNPTAVDVIGGSLRGAQGHQAPAQEWVAPRPEVATGTVLRLSMPGPRGGEQRRIWDYRPASGQVDGLLVLFDGETWAERQPIWPTLDNLAATGATPRFRAVLIESGGRAERTRDLACDSTHTRWLLDQVLPELGVADVPASRTVIAGQSLGGLTAMYLGHYAPDRFGNVLSQSGAFWFANRRGEDGTGPEAQWLTETIAALPADHPRPRCHLDVGTMEWVSLPLVRHMRDVLVRAGTEVSYVEYCGGHDTLCWQDGLATGLRELTSRWTPAP